MKVDPDSPPTLRDDIMAITKARLTLMVIVTTGIGFWVSSKENGFDLWLLIHTIFGTSLAALGSSVFNQLMEIDVDRKMERTRDRPLPAERLAPAPAFLLGAVLCGFGIVHLAAKVNAESSALVAVTLLTYVLIYTPMKRTSSWNTIVGAVSGAFPPMVGWAGAFGHPTQTEGVVFRWDLIFSPQSFFLFALLFFWQLPHFVAINWIYREQYKNGGFVMWSNDDDDGSKTSFYALLFTVPLVLLMAQPVVYQFSGWLLAVGGGLLGLWMLVLAIRFRKVRTKAAARKLFFYTLAYLPAILILLVIDWR